MSTNIVLSNPRKSATLTDYPIGGQRRGTCTLTVEVSPTKGERLVKTTTGNPKKATYHTKVAIVDGDDNKTYFLAYNAGYECITVYNITKFQSAAIMGEECSFHKDMRSDECRLKFNELYKLIEQSETPQEMINVG